MRRSEQDSDLPGAAYAHFERAAILEDQVRQQGQEMTEISLVEMEQHYQAMQMGFGLEVQQTSQSQQAMEPITPPGAGNVGQGQWAQVLSGSVLYYSVAESHNGIGVQTTQYMHLCPTGMAYFYQNSGGGGGAITALSQLEYVGASQWQLVEQGEQSYLQMQFQGQQGLFPLRVINDKVQIQGLGTFSVQRGGAQCP